MREVENDNYCIPCPICGQKPKAAVGYDAQVIGGIYTISCRDIGSFMHEVSASAGTLEGAVAKWNQKLREIETRRGMRRSLG